MCPEILNGNVPPRFEHKSMLATGPIVTKPQSLLSGFVTVTRVKVE